MSVTSNTIESIIKTKASVIVRSSKYSTPTLEGFTKLAHASGAKLTIKVDSGISSTALESIAKLGAGSVIIDLS